MEFRRSNEQLEAKFRKASRDRRGRKIAGIGGSKKRVQVLLRDPKFLWRREILIKRRRNSTCNKDGST